MQYRVAQPGEVLAARRQGAEPGRSRRRLHDLLPARDRGRPGRARRRGAAGARCRAAVRHSGAGVLRRRRRAVHAQDGRDGERAAEADVPGQGADRSASCCKKHIEQVKTGLPGVAYGSARPRRAVAGRAGRSSCRNDDAAAHPLRRAPVAPTARRRPALRQDASRSTASRSTCRPAAWSG